MAQGRDVAVPRGIVHSLKVARTLVPTESGREWNRLGSGMKTAREGAHHQELQAEDVGRGDSSSSDVTHFQRTRKYTQH